MLEGVRRPFVCLALCVGCSSASGSGDSVFRDDDAIADASSDALVDASLDGHPIVTDAFDATDATDAHPTDSTDAPPCTPKTTCGGAECGPIPDHCGATLACVDCGGAPGEWCETMTPVFQGAVHNAIAALASTSPAYFDMTDTTCGGNFEIKDAAAFVKALVAELSKKPGVVVIVDPRDSNEIRIRDAGSTSAENYHVVTSFDCTAYKYTSTCTPAGF